LLGNEAFSIVLFISIVIGLLTIGFAIFKIFASGFGCTSPLKEQPTGGW
jgi:hypothetical protein